MKLLFSVLLLFFVNIANAEQDVFYFGIVPLYSASETLQIWAPFATYASNGTDRIVIRTERSTQSFESAILSGKYDIAFMTAHQYEQAKGRYKALAVPKENLVSGAIITHKDSGIGSIKDLNSKQIAFASPDEYISSVIVQQILSEYGVVFEPVYLNSVSSVVMGTQMQIYPAGSVLNGFYENKSDLEAVLFTKAFSSYVIGVSARVPEETASYLAEKLLSMDKHTSTQKTLQTLGFSSFVLPRSK